MDRATRRIFAAILGVLVVGGLGLVMLGGGDPPSGPPDAPTQDGVVIQVDSAGLAAVSGFTLRTDDGRTLSFGLRDLRNGTRFPAGHLAEHLATSQRIRVWY